MGQSGLGLRCESVLAGRKRNKSCDPVRWLTQAWMRVLVGGAGLNHSGWRKREERTAHRQKGRVGEGIEEGSRETW